MDQVTPAQREASIELGHYVSKVTVVVKKSVLAERAGDDIGRLEVLMVTEGRAYGLDRTRLARIVSACGTVCTSPVTMGYMERLVKKVYGDPETEDPIAKQVKISNPLTNASRSAQNVSV